MTHSDQPVNIDWPELHRALGLSVTQLTRLLRVNRGAYSDWATGRAKPSRQTIAFLRLLLAHPDIALRLRHARFPHPWPEDVGER